MKTLVIAGTRQEAMSWIHGQCERRFTSGDTSVSMSDYIYIHDVHQIRGLEDPHGVFIGTWRDRKDIAEIVETLFLRSIYINRTLERIRKEIR